MGTKLKGGGTGTGAVEIYDEGILIDPAATKIDFKGIDILARNEGNPGEVVVYVPTPAFRSHFHTNDGIGSGIVADISTTNRHLSAPGAFALGVWAPGQTVSCIRTPASIVITYSPASDFSMFNLTTNLETWVYGADDVTPLAIFTFAADGINVTLDSNKITNNIANNIHYNIINVGADAGKSKCDLTITIDIDTIIPSGGRFSVTMIHDNPADGGPYTKTQGPMFFDPESGTATINGTTTIVETPFNVMTQTISGVYYYTFNSQFTVNVTDIDDLNQESYPTNQLGLEGVDYGLPSFTEPGSALTGWINAWNNQDASYLKTDWAVTAIDFFKVDSGATISSWPIDWVSEASIGSAGSNICVCTYTDNATGVYEDFKREDHRVQSDTAAWDNFENIKIEDDGQGLQISGINAAPSTTGSRLVFPSFDYSTYNPVPILPAIQPNYAAGVIGNGARWYMRGFWHIGTSHTNGLMLFGDHNITDADIVAGDIIIELSKDNIAWFDMGADWLGGILVNGSGCRINKLAHSIAVDNTYQFTLGLASSTLAGTGPGWGLWWRITFADTATGRAKYVGEVTITDW